ncbi:MAG: hypothetical protein MHMPM18_000401 [Marteilia pararefringens]
MTAMRSYSLFKFGILVCWILSLQNVSAYLIVDLGSHSMKICEKRGQNDNCSMNSSLIPTSVSLDGPKRLMGKYALKNESHTGVKTSFFLSLFKYKDLEFLSAAPHDICGTKISSQDKHSFILDSENNQISIEELLVHLTSHIASKFNAKYKTIYLINENNDSISNKLIVESFNISKMFDISTINSALLMCELTETFINSSSDTILIVDYSFSNLGMMAVRHSKNHEDKQHGYQIVDNSRINKGSSIYILKISRIIQDRLLQNGINIDAILLGRISSISFEAFEKLSAVESYDIAFKEFDISISINIDDVIAEEDYVGMKSEIENFLLKNKSEKTESNPQVIVFGSAAYSQIIQKSLKAMFLEYNIVIPNKPSIISLEMAEKIIEKYNNRPSKLTSCSISQTPLDLSIYLNDEDINSVSSIETYFPQKHTVHYSNVHLDSISYSYGNNVAEDKFKCTLNKHLSTEDESYEIEFKMNMDLKLEMSSIRLLDSNSKKRNVWRDINFNCLNLSNVAIEPQKKSKILENILKYEEYEDIVKERNQLIESCLKASDEYQAKIKEVEQNRDLSDAQRDKMENFINELENFKAKVINYNNESLIPEITRDLSEFKTSMSDFDRNNKHFTSFPPKLAELESLIEQYRSFIESKSANNDIRDEMKTLQDILENAQYEHNKLLQSYNNDVYLLKINTKIEDINGLLTEFRNKFTELKNNLYKIEQDLKLKALEESYQQKKKDKEAIEKAELDL